MTEQNNTKKTDAEIVDKKKPKGGSMHGRIVIYYPEDFKPTLLSFDVAVLKTKYFKNKTGYVPFSKENPRSFAIRVLIKEWLDWRNKTLANMKAKKQKEAAEKAVKNEQG